VILNFGPGARTFLTALDLETGKILWKHDEPGGLSETDKRMVGSWSTPMVVEVHRQEQILCSMPTRVIACDPETGTVLWSCSGLGTGRVDMVFPMPVISDDIAVAFAGWVNGPAMAFKLGGSGDVTERNRLWIDKQPQRIGSGIAVDGRVYTVHAGPGIAQCIECQTGKVLWSERLDAGESWGSLVLAAGRLYVTSRRGITTAFLPNPEKLEVLAMNDLGEASEATPATSDGHIFLRTNAHLYCIAED
jgi:outer membrane protein assembly factor BamB